MHVFIIWGEMHIHRAAGSTESNQSLRQRQRQRQSVSYLFQVGRMKLSAMY